MITSASLIALLLSTASPFLIPEIKSSKNNLRFCPEGFRAKGWILYDLEDEVVIEPHDHTGLSVSDNQIVIRFCESTITLPRGTYCVFEEDEDCPSQFSEHPFRVPVPHRTEESLSLSTIKLCCTKSTRSTITKPRGISLPFTLIRSGPQCQNIQDTTLTEITVNSGNTTLMTLCYYEVQISCAYCEQTCKRMSFGFMCACYPGYALHNTSHCIGTRTCAENNGQCDHICNYDSSKISCACYQGYYLYNDKICLPYNTAVLTSVVYNQIVAESVTETGARPLFSDPRDYNVVLITIAIFTLLVLIIFCILLKLNVIICTTCTTCSVCSNTCYATSCCTEKLVCYRTIIRRPKRRFSNSLNRNSISAPRVADVAVDLLNRPKTNSTLLKDLPSRASYYNTELSEAGYDSLDRRRRDTQTDRQMYRQCSEQHYEEPDVEQPLVVQGGSEHYLEPDEGMPPETPLPVYSNSEPQVPLYTDPAIKFSVGTLGRRGPGATVARIAPTPRPIDPLLIRSFRK